MNEKYYSLSAKVLVDVETEILAESREEALIIAQNRYVAEIENRQTNDSEYWILTRSQDLKVSDIEIEE